MARSQSKKSAKRKAAVYSLDESPKKNAPNRQGHIFDGVSKAVHDRSLYITIPSVLESTWDDCAQAKLDAVRESFRLAGFHLLRSALWDAFKETVDKTQGCLPGLYETASNIVLSDRVIYQILSKVRHDGEQRITGKGVIKVAPGFHVWLGAVAAEPDGADKVAQLVNSLFFPLLLVGIESYHSFVKPPKRARIAADGASYPKALKIIERMRKIQIAKGQMQPQTKKNVVPQPVLVPTPSPSPPVSPSSISAATLMVPRQVQIAQQKQLQRKKNVVFQPVLLPTPSPPVSLALVSPAGPMVPAPIIAAAFLPWHTVTDVFSSCSSSVTPGLSPPAPLHSGENFLDVVVEEGEDIRTADQFVVVNRATPRACHSPLFTPSPEEEDEQAPAISPAPLAPFDGGKNFLDVAMESEAEGEGALMAEELVGGSDAARRDLLSPLFTPSPEEEEEQAPATSPAPLAPFDSGKNFLDFALGSEEGEGAFMAEEFVGGSDAARRGFLSPLFTPEPEGEDEELSDANGGQPWDDEEEEWEEVLPLAHGAPDFSLDEVMSDDQEASVCDEDDAQYSDDEC